MVSVIQTFNGEDTRIVGRARTYGGVVRHVKTTLGASAGWGVKLRGTVKDLLAVGAHQNVFGHSFEFRTGNPRARRTVTVYCEAL